MYLYSTFLNMLVLAMLHASLFEHLCLILAQVTDGGVHVVFEKCPNLRRLDVASCDTLTDATLRSLGSNCSQLR